MANSPTSRTLAECRKRGWPAAITERWQSHWAKDADGQRFAKGGNRVDLFGFIDLLALVPLSDTVHAPQVTGSLTWTDHDIDFPHTLGIQACAGASHATREAKIAASEHIRAWLDVRNRCEVWSWSKRGARGKRKTWTLRVSRARLTDTGVVFDEIPQKESP